MTTPRSVSPSREGKPAQARRYLRPPQPVRFPTEEKVPESRRHMLQRTVLFQVIQHTFGAHATVGSEQFVYWDPTDPRQCCAPDVFVRLGQPDADFDCWKVWERGAPDLAVEVISATDASDRPWATKLERYRRLGVRELVRFDAEDEEQPLRIWDRIDEDLVEREPSDADSRKCDTLDCFWCLRAHEDGGRELYLSRDVEGAHPCLTDAQEREADARAQQREAEAQRHEAESRVRELEAEIDRLRHS